MINKGFHGETYGSSGSAFSIIDPDSNITLEIIVGPVFKGQQKESPGIWIQDYEKILACISIETWRALNKHVEENYLQWEKQCEK